MAHPRDAYIDPTTNHRIDPLTGLDIDQAIATNNNAALCQIEIAQLESMEKEFPGSWYVEHSLKLARRRLTKWLSKDVEGTEFNSNGKKEEQS